MKEKFYPLKSMTKKEFMIQHKAFEEGMVEGWKHIENICKICIKTHRKETRKKTLLIIAEMNKHLWKDK